MQTSATAEPTVLQGNLLANLVAGFGDGNWTSRAGVVLNQNTGFTQTISSKLSATHSATTLNGGSLPFSQYATRSASENILLSPQHFIESSNKIMNNESGNSSILQDGGGINPMLLNLDISTSNFNKAMKFNGVLAREGLENGDDYKDNEDVVEGKVEVEGFTKEEGEDGSSEYEEQSIVSDASNDVGENDEQDKLMDRFKQLRQWQVQQQELLMLQQQQQLEALRGEQEKVQRMIARHRETATSTASGVPHADGVVSKLPPMSPKKPSNVVNKDLHQATQRPMQRTPPNRPRPNLPSVASTPTEYRENGNPNLDSDTASTCTANTHDVAVDECVLPLPETAGDMNEFLQRKKSLMVQQHQQHGQNHPGTAAQQPSQFLKHIAAAEGEFPRKVLNFDPSETESQPEFAGLHDVESQSQYSQNNRQQFHQRPKQPVLNSTGTEALDSLGYTNLLNVPGIMQSLPEGILQQLLLLQQQGHNVVVDANGQLAVLPIPLPNGSQPQLAVNPLSRQVQQSGSENDGGMSLLEKNPQNAQSSSGLASQEHQHRQNGISVAVNSGFANTNSPPVHDHDHMRNVENNILDFRDRIDYEEEESEEMTDVEDDNIEHDKDDVGSYTGKVVMHGQNKGGDGKRVAVDGTVRDYGTMVDREEGDVGSYTGKLVMHCQKRGADTQAGDVDSGMVRDYGRMVDHKEDDVEEEMEQVDEDQVLKSEEEDDDELEEEESEDDRKENIVLDEVPVAGLGAQKKTFEELLEEELRKEEERMQQGAVGGCDSRGPKKQQFLRKGEGSARFGVNGKPPKPPQPVKRKSGTGSGKALTTSTKTGSQGTSSRNTGPSKQAEKKKQLGRKTAPKKTKPPDKLQLKPSPRKQCKASTLRTASGGQVSEETKTTAEEMSKCVHNTRKTGSQKSKLKASSKEKPESSEGSSDTGETSFQTRLNEIAKKEEVEHEELEEFEILEQFADDNVSFLSNLSAVNRALNHHQETTGTVKAARFSGKKSKPVSRTLSENDDTIVENLESEEEDTEVGADLTLTEDTDQFDHNTRTTDHHNNRYIEPSGSTSNALNTRPFPEASQTVANNPILAKLKSMKTMQRKVVPLSERTCYSNDKGHKDEEGDMSEDINNLQLSRVEQFSDSNSETEVVVETTTKNAAKSVISVTGHNKKSSKKGQQKVEGRNDEDSDDGMDCNEETTKKRELEQKVGHKQWGDNTGGGDHVSSGHQKKYTEQTSGQVERRRRRSLVGEESGEGEEDSDDMDFGDGEAWEDATKEEDDWEKEFLKSKSHKKSSSAFVKSKVVSADLVTDQTDIDGRQTPPTSKLVSKLFPKLKQDKPKASKQQTEKLEQVQQTEVGDGVQAKQLRDKLVELEREIERFRGENGALEKLRREREEGLDHLKKEMSEFQKQKDEELKRIQEYKAEETRKLKREKKLFEDYQKSIRNMPNKKEREEIDALKQQVSDLQDEMKRKEQRWTSSTTRLRDRIEQLEQENGELKEELKVIEQKRLEAWQQKEALMSASAGSSKGKQSEYLTSATANHTSQKSGSGRTSTQLKKSTSGPQLSTRSLTQINSDTPEPQKRGGATLQRDHNLRLSSTAEVIHGSGDAASRLSSDSEAIQPEDSASNVIANRLTHPHPHPRDQTHPLSLKSSTESRDSDPINHTSSAGSSKKPLPRKKAAGMSVSHVVEKGDGQFEEIQHQDGKVERIYTNGAREILFSNGTRKQVSSDGQSIIVSFFNGDIKQILPDQRVVYYYSEAETTHTTYPDGLEILQFVNQQCEKHYPDGTKEITFPDQTVKYLFPNGIEESIFPDGTVIRVEKNGDKTMEFPNGQREIHTPQYKRREYPDGTVKTVYPDGRQETRYSSGRIRVKDKEGVIIVDRRV